MDRLPEHRSGRHPRAALRRQQRHLRRAHRRLVGAEAGARRGHGSVVRCHRQARLRQRLPPGQGGARQRRDRRSGFPALGRRRRGPLPVRQRHADRAVARRQVGRLRRAVARLRRAVPAHGPSDRFEPDDGGLPDRAHLAGRGLQHPLVRRQPPGPLVDGPGALHARSLEDLHVPRRQSPDAGVNPRRRARTSASPRRPTRPPARSPSSAPGITASTRRERHRRRPAISPGARSKTARSSSKGTGSRPSAGASPFRPARSRSTSRGKTIMPGIIDVHGHVGGEGDGILAQSSWPLQANLAFGVTTTHDPSNDTETVFSNAELIRAGMKLGPRLLSTGTILYGAETPFKAIVANYDDALVDAAAAEGVRRLQRQELQPAAARRAADDHQGGARAADGGRARRRLAPLHERDDDPRRAHDGRALAARAEALQGRRHAVREEQDRLHADAHRRLRRTVWRVSTGTRRRTSGTTSIS